MKPGGEVSVTYFFAIQLQLINADGSGCDISPPDRLLNDIGVLHRTSDIVFIRLPRGLRGVAMLALLSSSHSHICLGNGYSVVEIQSSLSEEWGELFLVSAAIFPALIHGEEINLARWFQKNSPLKW